MFKEMSFPSFSKILEAYSVIDAFMSSAVKVSCQSKTSVNLINESLRVSDIKREEP